jgi:hypothetical protein
MKSLVLAPLMALLVTGPVADAPTLPSGRLGPAVPPLPLTVTLYCTSGLCEAYASGGSGTGYSFEWVSAAEFFDNNGISRAQPNCYWSYQIVGVQVTASDSNGATTTEQYPVNCGVPEP